MAEYKFKRTGAQMDALFDEVAEGGKIYQTTLPIREIIESTFTSIRASDELELTNIVNKAKEGYLILVPPGMVDFGYAGHLQSLSIEINGQILVNYEQGGSLDLSFLVAGQGKVWSVNISTNDPVETNPWIVSVKEIGGSGGGDNIEYSGGKEGILVGTSATYTASDCEIGKWYIFSVDLRFYATNSDYWLIDNIPLKLGKAQIQKACPSNSDANFGHAYFEIISTSKDIKVTIRSSMDSPSDFTKADWLKVSLIKM